MYLQFIYLLSIRWCNNCYIKKYEILKYLYNIIFFCFLHALNFMRTHTYTYILLYFFVDILPSNYIFFFNYALLPLSLHLIVLLLELENQALNL